MQSVFISFECHHDNIMSRVIIFSAFQCTRTIISAELLAWLQRMQHNSLSCLFCIADLFVQLNRSVN